jgi:hypothetical protein
VKLADARIGYAGYSRDFSAPGDRRRFAAYAKARNLAVAPADFKQQQDLVLVTHNGNIPGWTERKRRGDCDFKFVFELADSYFKRTGFADRYLKGVARRILGTDSRSPPDFLQTLIAACELADAVICSTEEQAATIRRYNPNVVTSFDWFGDDIGPPKADYQRGDKVRLVWEGQSTTLSNIRPIRDMLNDLKDRIELHVVTDPKVYRYFGRFLPHPSADLLQGIECDVHFHPWDHARFSSQITAADLAIIPIDLANAFARGKPENKLVMLWKLGMPVLTSDTPAYRRAMEGAGLDLLCSNSADWRSKLEWTIAASDGERERIASQGRAFAERAYSKVEFLKRFDRAFELAGFSS